MKARLPVLLLSLLVCAFSAVGQTVIESGSTIVLGETSVTVSLLIENKGPRREETVDLKLLDTDGIARGQALNFAVPLAPGKKSYSFSIPITNVMTTAGGDIAWWRLQYIVGDATGI